ncbi:DUF998 domain-containing protein [Actinopolymorpha alba]|uniref:DUF998 domain-containing protein n=1 Tax=Actinopolymorpha alba TaxID=533267 RepID=UPI00035CBB42|nr:DUF998 domain-containing protein [Actinopolymorpha alba]
MSTPTRTITRFAATVLDRSRGVRLLLCCGAVAGPLFVATVLIQAATREGFDPARHPLSALSQGDLGWIQTTSFIVTGLLATAGAVGARRALGVGYARTWGPRLLAVYGLALVAAAAFVTDPVAGFPSASSGALTPSWQGQLHNAAALVGGLALDTAGFVFARRFLHRGQHTWAAYSLTCVVADLAAGGAAALTGDFRWLLLGGVLTWTWASALSLELLRHAWSDDPAPAITSRRAPDFPGWPDRVHTTMRFKRRNSG